MQKKILEMVQANLDILEAAGANSNIQTKTLEALATTIIYLTEAYRSNLTFYHDSGKKIKH